MDPDNSRDSTASLDLSYYLSGLYLLLNVHSSSRDYIPALPEVKEGEPGARRKENECQKEG